MDRKAKRLAESLDQDVRQVTLLTAVERLLADHARLDKIDVVLNQLQFVDPAYFSPDLE